MSKRIIFIILLIALRVNFVQAASDYSYDKVTFSDKKDSFYEKYWDTLN